MVLYLPTTVSFFHVAFNLQVDKMNKILMGFLLRYIVSNMSPNGKQVPALVA